jgi:hypothetical protein
MRDFAHMVFVAVPHKRDLGGVMTLTLRFTLMKPVDQPILPLCVMLNGSNKVSL